LIYGLGGANVPGIASAGRQVFVPQSGSSGYPVMIGIRTLLSCTLIGERAAGLMTETQRL